jgi:hypothetical protein
MNERICDYSSILSVNDFNHLEITISLQIEESKWISRHDDIKI